MTVHQIEATVLFTPESESLRHLPEGPYRCPDGRLSWVAIQHGPNSQHGSLNLLDLDSGMNQEFVLTGRPGFAFPTNRAGQFVLGMERAIARFDTHTASIEILAEGIDRDVSNTIINDGVVHDGHLIFGCKDLNFRDHKAGLYLMKVHERQLIQLRDDQVCSNGKAVVRCRDGRLTLYDIDSPSQQVLAWSLDLEQPSLDDPRVVVDLSHGDVFPDGMILTPDQQGLIVALYDPRDSDHGEAHCYDIESGELRTVWRCAKSPRVTCPQLIEHGGRTQLVLTTADEGMPPAQRARCVNAGCIFIAETGFDGLNDNPTLSI